MKLKLKMIAVAAAMASMAGAANADVTSDFVQNGTLVIQAFNTVTRAYYIRDTGFHLNDFLPSGVSSAAGDPESAVQLGNKTSEAGLTLNAGNTASFGDASGWSTWIAGQTLSNIRWNVSAVDSVDAGGSIGYRMIASSANPDENAANGEVVNYVSGSYAGGVAGYSEIATGGTPGLSYTRVSDADNNLDINWGLGSEGLGVLDGTASLFYFISTGPAGPATGGKFANSQNAAVISLASNGDFTYTLAAAEVAAVPVPAAAWMLGSGLMAFGGMVRRRKVAAAAKA